MKISIETNDDTGDTVILLDRRGTVWGPYFLGVNGNRWTLRLNEKELMIWDAPGLGLHYAISRSVAYLMTATNTGRKH